MKNIFLAFGLAVAVAFSGCSTKSTNSSPLINKWKLENIGYSRPISEELKPIIQAQVNELKKTFTLEYNANGTYTAFAQKKIDGTWEMSKDGKTLENTENDSNPVKYQVLHLSKDSLAIQTKIDGEELVFEFKPQ